MTTQEIANRLVELVKAGDYKTCYAELYHPEVKSIEADGTVCNGLEEMAAKGKEWNERMEKFIGSECGEAVVSGNWFSLPMNMTSVFKGSTEPFKFEEICVYQVKDGKVVHEQFFYDPMG